jgi:hypothetical protein
MHQEFANKRIVARIVRAQPALVLAFNVKGSLVYGSKHEAATRPRTTPSAALLPFVWRDDGHVCTMVQLQRCGMRGRHLARIARPLADVARVCSRSFARCRRAAMPLSHT